jgi:hypothetical protein
MMGVEPEQDDLRPGRRPGELDSEKLAGYITKHACGLAVLPAPLRPEDAELVTEAKLGRLLEVARESFDVIVVDTSPFFHGPMLARSTGRMSCCSSARSTCRRSRTSASHCRRSTFCRSRSRASRSSSTARTRRSA